MEIHDLMFVVPSIKARLSVCLQRGGGLFDPLPCLYNCCLFTFQFCGSPTDQQLSNAPAWNFPRYFHISHFCHHTKYVMSCLSQHDMSLEHSCTSFLWITLEFAAQDQQVILGNHMQSQFLFFFLKVRAVNTNPYSDFET